MALAPYPWLEEPAQTLLAMRDRMPNAVLLYGAPGAGLYELALAFSKSLFRPIRTAPHAGTAPAAGWRRPAPIRTLSRCFRKLSAHATT